MSLMKENYNNSSGTTQRSFKIGKNQLTIDNTTDGLLKFTMKASNGDPVEWLFNADANTMTFPNGVLISSDAFAELLNRVATLEGKVQALEEA